jgi:hypothetical protein
MGKMTRTLALAGLALTAGMVFTAAPAMASPATPAGSVTSGAHNSAPASARKVQTSSHKGQSPRRDSVVGHYRTLRACDAAGRSGERRGRWDDYDCNRVRSGGRSGSWALQAHWGGDRHHDNHHDNRFINRHP